MGLEFSNLLIFCSPDPSGYTVSAIAAMYGNGTLWYQLDEDATTTVTEVSNESSTFSSEYVEYGVRLDKQLGSGNSNDCVMHTRTFWNSVESFLQ